MERGSVWESDFQGQETPCHLGALYTREKGQTPFRAHLLALTPPFLLLPGTLPSSASSVCLSSNVLWELCSCILPVPCELCVPVFCLFPVSCVSVFCLFPAISVSVFCLFSVSCVSIFCLFPVSSVFLSSACSL